MREYQHSGFYSIWEDTRHFVFTDKMEFHVIEFPKELRDDSGSNSDDNQSIPS